MKRTIALLVLMGANAFAGMPACLDVSSSSAVTSVEVGGKVYKLPLQVEMKKYENKSSLSPLDESLQKSLKNVSSADVYGITFEFDLDRARLTGVLNATSDGILAAGVAERTRPNDAKFTAGISKQFIYLQHQRTLQHSRVALFLFYLGNCQP